MEDKKNPNIVFYKTNVMCPKCGRRLYTPKYKKHDFHCKECLSDFNKHAVRLTPENSLVVEVPVLEDKISFVYPGVRKASIELNCNWCMYKADRNLIILRWDNHPVNGDYHINHDVSLFEVANKLSKVMYAPQNIAELEEQRLQDLNELRDLIQRVLQNAPIEFENSKEEFAYGTLGYAFDSLEDFLDKK